MVNNYPEYAAGVNFKKTDSNGVRHFYSAQVVADPSDETVESKLIKDGVVISGGGSSDFSTAEVTITTAESKANTIIFPFIYDGEYSMVGATSNNVGTQTYTIPLYKGEGDITLASVEEITVSVTGDIEYVQADGYIIVTGDGTITIS